MSDHDMRPWENEQTTRIWDETTIRERFLRVFQPVIWRQKHLNTIIFRLVSKHATKLLALKMLSQECLGQIHLNADSFFGRCWHIVLAEIIKLWLLLALVVALALNSKIFTSQNFPISRIYDGQLSDILFCINVSLGWVSGYDPHWREDTWRQMG